MEFDFSQLQSFGKWFPLASLIYLALMIVLTLGVLFVGWLLYIVRNGPEKGFSWFVTLFRQGPLEMFRQMGRAIWWGIGDLVRLSPRRVLALAWLAVKESIRRRVVVVFIIFMGLLLFGGWFIRSDGNNPAYLFISVVMTATSYLILLLTLILCTLSLPADLKNRTLHTIVTKPVRPSEIVLGRMLGFIAIGTILIALMGTISYFFVQRGLAHSHKLDVDTFNAAENADPNQPAMVAETRSSQNHFHRVLIDPDGNAQVEPKHGHAHAIELEKDPESGKIIGAKIGPNENDLIARVPIFGELYFFDRAGNKAAKGISVGKESTYRSYIEGGTKQAAVWTFENVSEDRFPEGLPVALHVRVFRSWKGIMNKGIPGSLSIRLPGTDKWIEALVFTAKDDTIDSQDIPRELQMRDAKDPNSAKKLDLFKDLVSDGKIEIQLRCMDPAQYFGVAQADLYLRSPDAPFFLNFLKGYLGIWLQMCLLTGIGVFFSTFLSGPVALLSTAGLLVGGLCHDFLFKLATGQTYGGGPFESVVRLLTQDNVISELTPGLRTNFVQSLDTVFLFMLKALAAILPNFDRYSLDNFVANGFNIPAGLMTQCLLTALAFLVPIFVASYLCFKMREVAK